MTTRGTGIVISTVSTVAVLDLPFMSSQGVAKAGLLKFHQQLDVETRSKGILSFAVNPGPIPSHIHDPDMSVVMDPEHFAREPSFLSELTSIASGLDWAAAGLASGTFVALCAEPKAGMLSGLYVDAETDLGELLTEMEKDPGRVKRERLYVLKVDEI
jgi:NAD(P)-dependent dehydrogenase (short-subunit alcohol dehydrogenase family)